MMKLWEVVLIIPTRIIDCEREFSKKNVIKDIRKSRLGLDTHNA